MAYQMGENVPCRLPETGCYCVSWSIMFNDKELRSYRDTQKRVKKLSYELSYPAGNAMRIFLVNYVACRYSGSLFSGLN